MIITNPTITIVRLNSGEDIIGTIHEPYVGDDKIDKYTISEPMTVGIDYRGKEAGLVMTHWLPVQLLKLNEVELHKKDILCLMEPNEDLCEYYLTTIQKIKDLMKAKNLVDSLDDDEVNEILDSLEDIKSNTIH